MIRPKVERRDTFFGPRVYVDWGWHDGGDHGHDRRCDHFLTEEEAEEFGYELLEQTGEPVDVEVSPDLKITFTVELPVESADELDAIQQAASAEGIPISEWIRNACRDRLDVEDAKAAIVTKLDEQQAMYRDARIDEDGISPIEELGVETLNLISANKRGAFLWMKQWIQRNI